MNNVSKANGLSPSFIAADRSSASYQPASASIYDRRQSARPLGASTSRGNENTFIKDERKEDEQYMASWHNYREGIRKRIGQKSGTILIEDQMDNQASKDQSSQIPLPLGNKSTENKWAHQQDYSSKSKEPSSSLKMNYRTEQPQAESQSRHSGVSPLSFNLLAKHSQNNQDYKSHSQIKSEAPPKQTHRPSSSNIDNLFKKYLDSPSQEKLPASKDVPSDVGKIPKPRYGYEPAFDAKKEALISTQSSDNLLKNIRDNIYSKYQKAEQDCSAKKPSLRVTSPPSHQAVDKPTERLTSQEFAKVDNSTKPQSANRTPQRPLGQNSNLLSCREGYKPNIDLQNSTNTVPPSTSKPNIEERLSNFRNSLSYTSTPSRQTERGQTTMISKNLREELDNNKKDQSRFETDQPTPFSARDASPLQRVQKNADMTTQPLERSQFQDLLKSPLRQKQACENIVDRSYQTAREQNSDIQMEITKDQIQKMEQQIRALTLKRQYSGTKGGQPQELTPSYMRELVKLSKALNQFIGTSGVPIQQVENDYKKTDYSKKQGTSLKTLLL